MSISAPFPPPAMLIFTFSLRILRIAGFNSVMQPQYLMPAKLSQLPCRVQMSGVLGKCGRFNWVLCTENQLWSLYCKLWLHSSKYLQCFPTALMPSAQERLCSVKDLRLWQMSSGKVQWSGLRCYCPWLSALPLHWSLQALDSSTERACATAAPVIRLVPWFKSPRRWVYATAGNQKHWGVGTLHLADSDTRTAFSSKGKMDVLDDFYSLAL